MIEHVLTVRKRQITTCEPTIVANGIMSDSIELSLDSDWDGLKVVVILGECSNPVKVSWEGNPITIPSQLTDQPGWLPVSVVGYEGERRVTTAEAPRMLRVIPSGCVDGNDPYPEQPDLLSQLLDARDEALDAAEDAREAIAGFDPGSGGMRGTQVSVTDGRPTIGGIEGDSAIDPVTGQFWEFVDDGTSASE